MFQSIIAVNLEYSTPGAGHGLAACLRGWASFPLTDTGGKGRSRYKPLDSRTHLQSLERLHFGAEFVFYG
jgi:hypothetical protein